MRGIITKRGKNSWQLRFDTAPINGERQRRYVTIRGSRKDAQKALTAPLAEADKGMLPEPTRQTVGEYMRAWLDSAHTQSPKTLERYSELSRCQITPHLGEVGLQKLRAEHLQKWHKEADQWRTSCSYRDERA